MEQHWVGTPEEGLNIAGQHSGARLLSQAYSKDDKPTLLVYRNDTSSAVGTPVTQERAL